MLKHRRRGDVSGGQAQLVATLATIATLVTVAAAAIVVAVAVAAVVATIAPASRRRRCSWWRHCASEGREIGQSRAEHLRSAEHAQAGRVEGHVMHDEHLVTVGVSAWG